MRHQEHLDTSALFLRKDAHALTSTPSRTTSPHNVPLWQVALAGGLHALLHALVVPGVWLWATALIAVAPLAWIADKLAGAARERQSDNPKDQPLLRSLASSPTLRIFLILWACCIPKEFVHHWWVLNITPWGLPPLLAIQAVWPALFVLLVARVRRRLPVLPLWLVGASLWTAIELFRGEIFAGGYRWALLAQPMIHAPLLREAGSSLGVYGVGTLLAAIGSAAAMVVRDREKALCGPHSLVGFAVAAAVLCGTAWFSAPAKQAAPASLRVTLLQTNVPPDNKVAWTVESQVNDLMRFDAILAYARKADASNPADLVIWPETMAPGGPIHPDVTEMYKRENVVLFVDKSKIRGPNALKLDAIGMWEWAEMIERQQADFGVPMLVGDDVPEGFRLTVIDGRDDFTYDRRFNSMLLIDKGEVTRTRYDKILPTPFGERMPVIGGIPWLQERLLKLAAPGMKLDLSSGSKLTRFEIPIAKVRRSSATSPAVARLATPICFEITSPSLCRKLVFEAGERKADVLANPTNDGWFGDSFMGKLMHLEHAQWRALELSTAMVRPANTGLTALIDQQGNVQTIGVNHPEVGVGQSFVSPANNTDGWLTVDAPLSTRTTLYARLGDWPAWGVACVGVVLTVGAFFGRRKD